jgi:hypothetical protein
MVAQELRKLQEVLTRKADSAQRDFIAVSEELKTLARRIQDTPIAEHAPLLEEREALHTRQQALADEINVWRDRARVVLRQPGEEALKAFLAEMAAVEDEAVRAAAERARFVMDAPEEELAKLAAQTAAAKPTTQTGRFIERTRTEYDLRGADPAPRRRAAVEFANRPGMAQNDDALAELEAVMEDPDPIVRGLITATVIQIHRIRATRAAELELAHASVKRLRQIQDPAVIPVFIEVLSNPRTGFVPGEGGELLSGNNNHTRRLALGGLVEWHTPEAQQAVRACQFDRDPQIVKLAARALEMFPGAWKGPTEESRRPPPVESNRAAH